jgi:hypothetical protein
MSPLFFMSETSASSSPAAAETGIGSQVKFKAGFPGALSAKDINGLEQAALLERRRLFADPQQEVNLENVSGLAFSGGGIRSATFCLGVAQVLQRRGLLQQFDYLSTVSGGGYFGSFLSCYLGTGAQNQGVSRFEEAFDAENGRESTAIRHLRNNSRYLLHGGVWGRLAVAGQLMAGVIFNAMLVLPLTLLAALAMKVLEAQGYFGKAVWLVDKPEELLTGLREFENVFGGMFSLPGLPTVGSLVAFGESIQAAWFPGWETPASSVLVMSLSVLTALTLLMPVFQTISHGDKPASADATWRMSWDVLTLLVLLFSLAALGLWLSPAMFRIYSMTREGLDLLAQFEQLQGRLDAILAAAGLFFSSVTGYISMKLEEPGWKKKVTNFAFLVSGPALMLWVFLSVGWRLMTHTPESSWSWQSVASVTAVLALWGWLGVNVNTYSPHGYYRNRLCECYLACRDRNESGWFGRTLSRWLAQWLFGAAAAEKKPAPVQSGVFGTLQQLALTEVGINRVPPYHLINTTVNLTTSKSRELRGRNGDFFLISPKVCGSAVCGYVRTEEIEKRDPHVDLGTALAVSGAAASSNMGWKTLNSLRLLMTLTNVRLGYWLPNPALKPAWPWLRGPGPQYLFKEMFGLMNEHDSYLNLSDGGHIENLAVYELLRRRVKFIVCVDGGQESGMECADLVRLQRYAEIDLGIRMAFDPRGLALTPDGTCPAYGLLVRIDYGAGNQGGWMLYVKLAVTGTEPAHVLDYRREHPEFPHQSTSDQIFDEAQFESYRALGECAMEKFCEATLINRNAGITLPQWFGLLRPPEPPGKDELQTERS